MSGTINSCVSRMSSLKSASFYLQKIIDFFREKTIEFGSIGAYLEKVKTSDAEVLTFLEKVIMNRHRYELSRQRFIDDANKKIATAGTMKIVLIVLNAVIGALILAAVLMKSNLLDKSSTFFAKLKTLIVTALVVFVMTIAFYLSIVYNEERKSDYEGARALKFDGERFFDKFESKMGVAMYYALKLKFTEPTGPDRKHVKAAYDELVTAKETRPARKLSVSEVRQHPEWPKIVDECRPEYILYNPQTSASTASKDGQTRRELEALAKEEDTLRLWDNAAMLQEIRTKSLALLGLVTKLKEGDVSDKMNDEDIAEVVKKEVVPLFRQRDVIHLDGFALKDSSAFSYEPLEEFTVENQEGCLLYLQQTPDANLVLYDGEKKTCTAYSLAAFPKTAVLKSSKNKSTYIISTKDEQPVFLEAGPLTKQPKESISEARAKSENCAIECMDDPSCVGYARRQGVCSLSLSMERPPFDTVELACSGDANCTTYKFDVKEIGHPVDALGYFDDAKQVIKQRVVDLGTKYNYEFSFLKYIDVIRNELDVYYSSTEFDVAMGKVTEILEAADAEMKNSVKSMSNKFISYEKFQRKLNDMTLGELIYYQQNVIFKLHNVIYILHEKVQDGLANQTSIERNMFVDKERALQRQKIMVWSMTAVLMLGFAFYAVTVFEDPDTNKGEISVRLLVPLVLVGLIVAVAVSHYAKQTSLYQYNRSILESNDTKLLDAMYALSVSVESITSQPKKSVKLKIKELKVREEYKRQIYENSLKAIGMLERCNLITDASNILLPFPYIDMTIQGGMVLVSFVVIGYMLQYMSPVENVMQIRLASKIVQLVKDHPGKYRLGDFPELDCIAPSTTPLKVIGAIVFVVIAAMYSNKILRSGTEYTSGLYNSRYFAESRCVDE